MDFDVMVLGAGPGGSAAAAWLAQQGLSVCLVEELEFPRFKIGESLLPKTNHYFQKIGVWDKIESAGFVRKSGAEFTTSDRSKTVHNVFNEALIPGFPYTYQVRRDRFDQLLLEHAVSCGAMVFQPARIAHAVRKGNSWTLRLRAGDDERTIKAKWIIDGGGSRALMPKVLGIEKRPLFAQKRVAIYNHFCGAQDKTLEKGNIIITRIRAGWFWIIPLSDELTSVGVVLPVQSNGVLPEERFAAAVEGSELMREVLQSAEPVGDFQVTSDYSYMCDGFSKDGVFLVGDAAGFIDPIFSSGVGLAVESGVLAAEAIVQAKKAGQSWSKRLGTRYTRRIRKRMHTVQRLVEVFYDDAGFSVFMHPSNRLQLFRAVNAVVSGHTSLPLRVKWRYYLFLWICRMNKNRNLVPAVKI